jgi:oxalate decarboxylase/phosphoglucose isomerase-like protein (cupin superfamily)
VAEGRFAFTLGNRTVELTAGGFVTVPKSELHCFRNVGEARGRLVVTVWPAVAFEQFVAEVGTCEPGPVDIPRLRAAATKHGIEVPPPAQGAG